jgi:uncharacterized repeat protein (TIGR03803 family)
MNKCLARSAVASTFVFLFVLVAAAGAQTYSVLTSFDDTDGTSPDATPLIDSLGNVFSTTPDSSGNCGVVYELENNGGGSYTNETLYNFTCGQDGAHPFGGLVMDSAGNLYGTAQSGGPYDAGVAYELVNHGGGSYKFEVIHAFSSGKGGSGPVGDLVMSKGSLYGVTIGGGGGPCHAGGCGTVYRLTKSGGKWVETVLHIFNDRGDGYYPSAGVALDSGGNIYGTTAKGGTFGYGTVFKLSLKEVLWNFLLKAAAVIRKRSSTVFMAGRMVAKLLLESFWIRRETSTARRLGVERMTMGRYTNSNVPAASMVLG